MVFCKTATRFTSKVRKSGTTIILLKKLRTKHVRQEDFFFQERENRMQLEFFALNVDR